MNIPQRAERSEHESQLTAWEYKARNLNKVPGMAIEGDFNRLGREGWEFVAITGERKDHYAIFKRQLPRDRLR